MSPVGRIFIVINLLLSGCFVYFSGVYLREAADFKAKYDAEVSLRAEDNARSEVALRTQLDDLSTTKRQLDAATTGAGNLETQLRREREVNEANDKRIAGIMNDLSTLQANTSTTAAAIERSVKDAEDARKMAIDANKQRDDAVRAKEVAVADLRDAKDQIATLDANVAERDELVAVRDATIRGQAVKLEWFATKLPGAGLLAQPKLGGTVQRIDAEGKLLTILVTDDPSEVGVKAGYTFAVFQGQTYKGEAQVTDVDGKFAFCRVTRSNGKPITVGDAASTQTN